MINIITVKQALYDWVNSIITDETIVWYYPNAPRPSTYYTTLFLNNLVISGQDYVPRPDSLAVSEIVGNRSFSLEIQTYGGDVMTRLETLRASLQKPSIQDSLRESGIVVVNQQPIVDLTQIINTGYETRAAVDCFFRIAQTQEDSLGIIQAVDGEYIYNNAGTEISGSYAIGEPYNP